MAASSHPTAVTDLPASTATTGALPPGLPRAVDSNEADGWNR
jgi:hypothetical protein